MFTHTELLSRKAFGQPSLTPRQIQEFEREGCLIDLHGRYSLHLKKQGAEGPGLFSLDGVGGGDAGMGFTALMKVVECSQGCALPG